MEQGNGTELTRLEVGILDSLPEPAVLVDRDHNVIAANQAAEAQIGVTYPGRKLALSFRHPAALEAVERVLEGGAARTVEVTFLAPAVRIFQLMVAPLRGGGAAGEGGAILAFHNVTAERRAEQMRADFVANASHELRSPLSALVGFIETLRGLARDDAAAREKFLDIMAIEAGRMTRLIDDLLSLSAIEANEHVAPEGKVAVADLARGVAEALAGAAAERKVTIVVEVADDLPYVHGDPDQVAQVLRNLAENAIAYCRTGSEVRISARALERMPDVGKPGIALAVSDEGEGIAREHLPRLTERFYRVNKARSREAGGTGLGLAIVKHIVNRHRGRLSVESVGGEGSTFTVSLPAA